MPRRRSLELLRSPQSPAAAPRLASRLISRLISRELRALCGLVACLAGLACSEAPMPIEEIEALHTAGRFEQTIEPLRAHLEQSPDDARLQFLYGKALWSVSRPGLALWALKQAMQEPEYRVPAGKLLINTYIMGEAWDDAEAVCDEILADVGEDPEILTLRAYARQGSRQNYEGAIEDADRVLELDPDNHEVLIPRTVALLSLNRVEEADAALRELDALYRDERLGLTGSGKFCTAGAIFAFEKGEPELALERFDRCLEEFPANAILLARALEFFDMRRDFERSIEILEAALAEEPESQQFRENLALRLEAAGRRDDAVDVLKQATEQASVVGQVQAWSTLAAFHASTGDVDGAIDAYARARERLTTRSPDLDFRYADALVHGERYDEALAMAETLSVPSHRLLVEGRALLALDRPAEALERLGEGNRLWPNNAVARYYTAVAAEQVGDLERAIEEYRYSVRVEPAATDASIRLAYYYLARNEGMRAVSALSLANESHPNALETQLLAIRIMSYRGAWQEAPQQLTASLNNARFRPLTIAALADGIRDRDGTEGAIDFIERIERLDLKAPRNAPVLTRLVEWSIETGRSERALELAEAARATTPGIAALEALYARALHASGGDPDRARALYEAALARDAAQPVALRGLAALLADRDDEPPRIVELLEKAIEAKPRDPRPSLQLAAYLTERGEQERAIGVLEDLLKRRPWDPEAALRLADALLDRDPEAHRDRARALLEWAGKLRGGPSDPADRFEAISRRLEGEPAAA